MASLNWKPGVVAAIVALLVYGAGGVTSSAHADVAIFCQTSNVTAASGTLLGCAQGQVNTGVNNILFSDPAAVTTGTTITGITNNAQQTQKTAFNFTSNTDTLLVNNANGGNATIASTNGGVIDNLQYYISPTQPYGSTFNAFTVLDTNLDVTHPSGSVQFFITATTNQGGPESFTSVLIPLTSGGNKFEFRALNGEVITKVAYQATGVSDVTVETVKQDQITLGNVPGGPGQQCAPGVPCNVPEPGSLALLGGALLGTGLLGFVFTARNRKVGRTNQPV